MDAVYGFPAVLSALLVTSVFGPGVLISMVAVGIASVPIFARLTRASVLTLKGQEFVVAARALGAGDLALLGRHVLPNSVSPLVVQATISFPIAILAEAALSYLGLGTQPPNPPWGSTLRYDLNATLGRHGEVLRRHREVRGDRPRLEGEHRRGGLAVGDEGGPRGHEPEVGSAGEGAGQVDVGEGIDSRERALGVGRPLVLDLEE